MTSTTPASSSRCVLLRLWAVSARPLASGCRHCRVTPSGTSRSRRAPSSRAPSHPLTAPPPRALTLPLRRAKTRRSSSRRGPSRASPRPRALRSARSRAASRSSTWTRTPRRACPSPSPVRPNLAAPGFRLTSSLIPPALPDPAAKTSRSSATACQTHQRRASRSRSTVRLNLGTLRRVVLAA